MRKQRILPAILLFIVAVIMPHASAAGDISGAAYNLGVGFGLASYQNSVGQYVLASDALRNSRHWHDVLRDHKILSKQTLDQEIGGAAIELARQQVEGAIRAKSNNAANAYRLGLLVALAEGQSTSASWSTGLSSGAKVLAADAINQALTVLNQNVIPITGNIFNIALLQKALGQTGIPTNREIAYSALLQFRTETSDAITRSAL